MDKFREKYFSTNDDLPQKNKIEDILYPDEQIVEHLTPHRKAYIWSQILFNISTIITWIIADGFFIFLFIKLKFFDTDRSMFIFLMCFFALHLYPVWEWLYKIIATILKIRREEYYITNQRVIVKVAGRVVKYRAVAIENIYDIQVKINFIDQKFKVGDIVIQAQKTDPYADKAPTTTEACQLVLLDQQQAEDKVALIQKLKKDLYEKHQEG